MNDLMKKLIDDQKRTEDIEKTEKEDIKEWIQTVNALYGEIEKWLAEEKKAGLVKFHRSNIYLPYVNIKGDYEITRLSLEFPGDYIFVDPEGRYIFGAIGRVDIYNSKNPIEKFTVLRMKNDKKWYILKREKKSFEHIILGLLA